MPSVKSALILLPFLVVALYESANAVSMYFEDNVTKTWDDALSDCMDRGMELAILNSQIEYDNASALITSRTNTSGYPFNIWIGYRIRKTSDGFEWINGKESKYEPWGPSEPDYIQDDSCVYLNESMQFFFDDSICTDKYYFLCTEGSAPVIQDHAHNRTYLLGSEVDLHCFYTSLWEVNVTWIVEIGKISRTIIISEEPVLYSEKNQIRKSDIKTNLILTSLDDIELGTYRCRVENIFGVAIGPINIVQKRKEFDLETSDVLSWDDARLECQEDDMELAILNSKEDHEEAKTIIINNGLISGRVWIGMYGDNNKQSLSWINGISVEYVEWSTSDPIDWSQSYPNGTLPNTKCVGLDISDNYTFVDPLCTEVLPYLCTEGSVPSVYTPQTIVYLINGISKIILECPYKSQWPIIDVLWQKKTWNQTIVLDQLKDTNIYTGGTIQNSSLEIDIQEVTANGIYRCFVENKFGLGRGNNIRVSVEQDAITTENNIPVSVEQIATTTENNIPVSVEQIATTTENNIPVSVEQDATTTENNIPVSVEQIATTTENNIPVSVEQIATTTENNIPVSVEQDATTTENNIPVSVEQIATTTENNIPVSVEQSATTTLSPVNDSCTCNCWANRNKGNYTLDELRNVLLPVTEQIRKELLVDTTILSKTINKRICVEDNRPSSKGIGVAAIIFISILLCVIVLADLTSFYKYVSENK